MSASVSITIGGNSTATAKVTETDPVAIGAIATADSANTFLQIGSPGAGAVDLAAGTVRVLSAGASITKSQGSFPSVVATMSDKITIHGAGPTALVKVHMDVEAATLLTQGTDQYGSQAFLASLTIGMTQHRGIYNRTLSITQDNPTPVETYKLYGYPSDTPDCIAISGQSTANHSAPKFTVVNDVELAVETPTSLVAELNAQGDFVRQGWASSIDCRNTARLAIELPAGYTMTSESGVLLTKSGTTGLAVPEDGGAPVVHGSPDAPSTPSSSTSSSSSSSGAATVDGGSGGGGSDDGGCNVSGGASMTGLAVFGVLAWFAVQRRRRTR